MNMCCFLQMATLQLFVSFTILTFFGGPRGQSAGLVALASVMWRYVGGVSGACAGLRCFQKQSNLAEPCIPCDPCHLCWG